MDSQQPQAQPGPGPIGPFYTPGPGWKIIDQSTPSVRLPDEHPAERALAEAKDHIASLKRIIDQLVELESMRLAKDEEETQTQKRCL